MSERDKHGHILCEHGIRNDRCRICNHQPDAMPRAGSTGYARLGGQAVFDAVGSDGMRAKGAKSDKRNGGAVRGQTNVENGFFGCYGAAGSIRTLDGSRRGGIKQCHIRWHVARGVFQPKCSVCIEELDSRTNIPETQRTAA